MFTIMMNDWDTLLHLSRFTRSGLRFTLPIFTRPPRGPARRALFQAHASRLRHEVLVTGASGFIGGAVVRALVKTGTEVRVIVRKGSDTRNLTGLPVEQVEGDLRNHDSLVRALQGCRQLYHVAAHYALWSKDPSIFYDINVAGTRNVLEAARHLGLERTVYCSTIGAIGIPAQDGGIGTETTPVSLDQMAGHYKRSKYLAEQEVLKLARAGLPVVIVNPSAPVGERQRQADTDGTGDRRFHQGPDACLYRNRHESGRCQRCGGGSSLGDGEGPDRRALYLRGNKNLMLREVFEILSRLTGVDAPRIKLPRLAILPLAHVNEWLARFTNTPPRIPLEGIRMAKYKMHYDCSRRPSTNSASRRRP